MYLQDVSDWIALLLPWLIGAAFWILGGFLLAGKGANWIAGYNLASDREKAQYNEKKLCRGFGVACILWGIAVAGGITAFVFGLIPLAIAAAALFVFAFAGVAAYTRLCKK